MKSFKNLSLAISLLPFLFIIYVSSLNTNKDIKIKLLVWEFNQQNIATILLLGSSFGFSLSALNVYLLSSQPQIIKSRVTKSFPNYTESIDEDNYSENNEAFLNSNEETDSYYIERDVREPTPTVSVPYKIIRRRTKEDKNSARVKEPSNSQNSVFEDDLISNDYSINNEDWALIDLEQW